MSKYAMFVVAIAAVVLLSIDFASARDWGSPGTASNPSTMRKNMTTGSGSQATTQEAQTQIDPRYRPGQTTTTRQAQPLQQTQQGVRPSVQQDVAQNVQQIRANSQKKFSNVFTSQWYAKHPKAWRHAQSGANMWKPVNTWSTLANWVDVDDDSPSDYMLVFEEDTYYLNDQAVPARQYLYEITDLATQDQSETATADPNGWMPLGVFVIAAPNSTQAPNRVFQFAMHKNGQLAGTCYDASSGKPIRISGSLDKENQRVAWMLGEDKQTVMESKLGSFVESQSTVTLHQGGNAETMTMVRLEGPVKQTHTGKTNQGSTGSTQQK